MRSTARPHQSFISLLSIGGIVAVELSASRASIQTMSPEAPQTPSGLEAIEAQIDAFSDTLRALVKTLQIRYYDINADGRGLFVIGWNPHRWGDTTPEALQHSGKARREWEA